MSKGEGYAKFPVLFAADQTNKAEDNLPHKRT
jgi:hypothetical protein